MNLRRISSLLVIVSLSTAAHAGVRASGYYEAWNGTTLVAGSADVQFCMRASPGIHFAGIKYPCWAVDMS